MGMQRVSDAFIGNTEIAEMFGIPPPNVRKMMVRRGIEGQRVKQGTRWVYLYQRIEVERAHRDWQKGQRKRRDNGRQEA